MNSKPQESLGPERLLSLDVLRGFDMFWIVLGEVAVWSLADHTGWPIFKRMEEELRHPWWNGFTFYDLVFPLFMFIAGVSFPFSLAKRLERGDSWASLHWHVIWRGLVLFLLGWIRNGDGLLTFNFAEMDYVSVLGRIGLAYTFGTLIAMHTRSWRGQVAWVVGILLGYWAALMLIPVPEYGAGDLRPGRTLACYIDKMYLPGDWHRRRCHSEGILSTIPSIVNVLAGILAGEWLRRDDKTGQQKAMGLFVAGVLAWAIGKGWDQLFPINKTLWTSSFAMVTVGWSLVLLTAFYLVIDVWKFRRGTLFFVVIGVNPLVFYMADRFVNFQGIAELVFGDVLTQVHPVVADFAGLLIAWSLLYVLYRNKIFWRV